MPGCSPSRTARPHSRSPWRPVAAQSRRAAIALTGAPAPATVDEHPVGYFAPITLADGQVSRSACPRRGAQLCLGPRWVRRAASPWISGDRHAVMARAAAIRPGDVLPIGPAPAMFPNVDVAPMPALSAETLILHALRGPRDDWLANVAALAETVWTVLSRSDRVGLRLEGTPLQRHTRRSGMELPSEGVVRGADQVPPGGEPVIFMADPPVTGGYPVVAVLVEDDADRAAQSVPGQQIRILLAE